VKIPFLKLINKKKKKKIVWGQGSRVRAFAQQA
jgi:hypothetical protein